jgi:uncharacterized integral membrane protein
MFKLDTAITEWRRQMLAAGIKTPVPLEELESHLRDDMEQQMRSGLSAQRAFEAAVQRIGQADSINGEFKKADWMKCRAKSQWQMLWTGGFGLVLTVTLNFVGLFIFHRSSSVFFSHKWWSAWVPSYIVWIIFTITGLAIGCARWKAQRSLQPD